MKMKNVAIAVVTSLGLFAAAANAAATPSTVNGGTVHFTGQIVAGACAVSTDTEDQTVNLGQYTTAQLSAAGDVTQAVPFTIKLVNCSTAGSVALTFSGAPTDSGALFAVSSGSNITAATNVGIQILDSTGTALTPGTAEGNSHTLIEKTDTNPDATTTLNYSARYKTISSASAGATAGQANADVTFTITYS